MTESIVNIIIIFVTISKSVNLAQVLITYQFFNTTIIQ